MPTLVQQRDRLQEKVDGIAEEIQRFREHLASDKFKGTETDKHVCPRCQWDSYTEHRKDWIATSDVNLWLARLQDILS